MIQSQVSNLLPGSHQSNLCFKCPVGAMGWQRISHFGKGYGSPHQFCGLLSLLFCYVAYISSINPITGQVINLTICRHEWWSSYYIRIVLDCYPCAQQFLIKKWGIQCEMRKRIGVNRDQNCTGCTCSLLCWTTRWHWYQSTEYYGTGDGSA